MLANAITVVPFLMCVQHGVKMQCGNISSFPIEMEIRMR